MKNYPKYAVNLFVITFLVLASCSQALIVIADDGYTVDESTPIGAKWVKLGGAAVIGNPTSFASWTPNGAARYQKFENGVIVYSEIFGAVLISNAVFDKWLSLRGQVDASGNDLFSYIGVPKEDYTIVGGIDSGVYTENAIFNCGMIIACPPAGTAFAIYGKTYLRYSQIISTIGNPSSEEMAIPGVTDGRYQNFDNGVIYYNSNSDAEAHEVHGPILARWLALGGPGGSMGFPISDVQQLIDVQGQVCSFEGGKIYYSENTGAWEVCGDILCKYTSLYGGPAGLFGFPISGQSTTPTSGGLYNDFQNGTIVYHASGDYQGTYAFNNLQLYVDSIATYGPDWWFDLDSYVNLKVTTNDGSIVNERLGGGDSSGFSVRRTWDLAQPVNSGTTVNVWLEAKDSDPGNDDWIGTVNVYYSIDNLWGLFEPTMHSADNGGDKYVEAFFNLRYPLPYSYTDFPGQLFWSFSNFKTEYLTYQQYAQTFSDVEYTFDDTAWEALSHPFNFAYYLIAYEYVAETGNCYGMSLESINAQKGSSMYSEPIFQYFPDTQTGKELPDSTNDGKASLVNQINVMQGYQVGESEILWFLGQTLTGNTHDPVQVFKDSKAAYERGDNPSLSIFNSYFWGGGHSVLPYKWDDTDPRYWRIDIADSNNPAGAPDYYAARDDVWKPYTPSYIIVDSVDNTFTYYPDDLYKTNYHGSASDEGRMMYFPYSTMDEPPVTPFWDVVALLGTVVILVGDTGQTSQITDDASHTFYDPGLVDAPTRWDQINQGDSSIPNLARIEFTGQGSGSPAPEVYAGNGEGFTYHYEMLPREGVADGTPYDWVFNSGTLSTHLTIPGTINVPDEITVSQSGTPDEAISLAIPATGLAKDVAWIISSGVKERWAKLAGLKMVPGQTIEVKLNNGGYGLEIQNSGPDTTAVLEVRADDGSTPVTVGEISIPNGTSSFRYDAPKTTLTYTGGQTGNDGWLLTPVTVTLEAFDYSGTGIKFIEYSLDGVMWTQYSGPFAYAEEGETTLYYRAMDKAGDQEAMKSQTFKIDTRQPSVEISLDKPSYTRVELFVVHDSASDPVPGSGLASITATLDGNAVTDGQSVNLFAKALGTHTLTVQAYDVAGWSTTKTASFEMIATLDSLSATIIELRRLGRIDNDGIMKDMLAFVDAAKASQQRSQKKVAVNQLQALQKEIKTEPDGHITHDAVVMLSGDVQYVITHLK